MFEYTSRSETKHDSRRKEQSPLVKMRKSAMILSISPPEEESSSKAKKSINTLYDERVVCYKLVEYYSGLMNSYTDFTSSPKQEKKKKAMSTSPSRPWTARWIPVETFSTFDRLMMSMDMERCRASSSTRLQPQLMSSPLGLTSAFGWANDVRGIVMTGFDGLRQNITKRIDRVEERTQQCYGRLGDELANAKSQANCDHVQLVQNTDLKKETAE